MPPASAGMFISAASADHPGGVSDEVGAGCVANDPQVVLPG